MPVAEQADGGRGLTWRPGQRYGAAEAASQAAGLGVIGVDHVLDPVVLSVLRRDARSNSRDGQTSGAGVSVSGN